MFLAALIFSMGLWTGVRAWRPPVWWIIAILAFALAIAWFVSRRAWLARALALGIWFLFGAFLIQIRGGPTTDPRLAELADGRVVTLTAHVIREGYAHAAGARSNNQSLDIKTDVQTEQVESDGKVWPIRAGIRLSLYEQPEKQAAPTLAPTSGSTTAGSEALEVDGRPTGMSDGEVTAHESGPTPDFSYGTRLRIRAKLHAARNFRNPGAFDYEGYLRNNGINVLGSARVRDVERLPGFSGSRVALW
ncbi:MAG: ComEC/Rec2 family competence protein, partial [Mycobacterium sp.]